MLVLSVISLCGSFSSESNKFGDPLLGKKKRAIMFYSIEWVSLIKRNKNEILKILPVLEVFNS